MQIIAIQQFEQINQFRTLWCIGKPFNVMNIFNNLKQYGSRWEVKSVRKFTVEEIAMVEKAQVIESQYGGSVCFFLKNGMATSVPLDNDAKFRIGDFIDMNTAEIVTLTKHGESDIIRIRG